MARVEPYLVAYDIADRKRLRRVHKILKKWGCPVQYSVFAVDLDARGLDKLSSILRAVVDAENDDLRIYRMPKSMGSWIGVELHGEGFILTGHAGIDRVRDMGRSGEFDTEETP